MRAVPCLPYKGFYWSVRLLTVAYNAFSQIYCDRKCDISSYRVMKVICCFLFLLLPSFTEQRTAAVCPPWFIPDNSSTTGCTCHNTAAIKCWKNSPLLQFGYCITYNNANETTEDGACPYIARYRTIAVDHVLYIQLPDNVSLLNEFMCGPLNREGTLCGKCKDGYGTALYSYTLECSKCWGHGYEWALYYFLELFPITVMYFLVVIFHIKATSSPLSALVFMSQIIVYTVRLDVHLHMYIENEAPRFLHVALKVLLVLCGIWSLDFFRAVIPPFCVSGNIKNIHALALEYVVAFYPICLILITFACIKLHDNNFRPVVWLWKPFHRHFVHLRRRWDSTASIINAFTTFLLLSFSKILFVSFTLLYTYPIHYKTNSGDKSRKYVLYYDPTVESDTQGYSVFATLASFVLVAFIGIPTVLLILYPIKLFRRCVSCSCGSRRWHALHIFIESFQGPYKDGTDGTRDFRMFSAAFLILRIMIVASFMNRHLSAWPSSEVRCALFVIASCLYATLRPYRLNSSNDVDNFILVLIALCSLALLAATNHSATNIFTCSILISVMLISIPHLVLIFYICYTLAKRAGIALCLKKHYQTLKAYVLEAGCTRQTETDTESRFSGDSLPDRLINPKEYEPVPQTTEKHTAAEPTESTDTNEPVSEEPRRLIPVYTYGSIN